MTSSDPCQYIRNLLIRKGEPCKAVIAIYSAGDVADGFGDEILWVSDGNTPMYARMQGGLICEVGEGWEIA